MSTCFGTARSRDEEKPRRKPRADIPAEGSEHNGQQGFSRETIDAMLRDVESILKKARVNVSELLHDAFFGDSRSIQREEVAWPE